MKVRFYKTGLTRSLFLFAFALLSTVAYSQTVTSVTATPNTGSFNAGDVITITINFSAAVDIDATKSIALTLETGATDAVLTYGGPDQLNVTSMQLSYTVAAPHTSADLEYASTTSFVLQSNAIEVAGGSADIDATLPALGSPQSIGGSSSIIIDTTPPASPSAPDLASGSDSGSSNSDDITNINTPTVTGTAEDGSTVTITSSVNGVVGTGTATGGNYSIALSALNEGAHNLTAVATDVAGNSSSASAALAITIDVTAPAAPGNPVLDASSDTGSSNADQITSDNTPLITGTGVDGTTLTLTSNVSGAIGSMTVAGGVYSITSSTLAAGAHTITATASDLAGNSTPAAMTLSITVDTSAPATPGTPDLDNADDTGSSNTDNVTNAVTFQTFSGTTEANAAVEIFDGVASLGTTTASGAGAWTIDLNLASGTYSINIVVKDLAGNTSAASPNLVFVVDNTAPATPSVPDLTSGTDSGSSNSDNLTNNTTPTVTGTAEADAVIVITSDVNGTVGTGVATSGNYSIALSALNEAVHNLTAVATDLAGNSSSATTALTVTIDVTAPAAPGTPDLDATSDSGSSSTDNYTNDNTPLITGTGVDGTTVTLTSNVSGAIGSVVVAGGAYSITSSTLASGAHTITAVATDAAGNASTSSASLSMTVDTSAPAVPTALDLAAGDDTGTSSTDNITKNTTALTISGSSDASVSIELFRAGSISLGTTTASGGGAWSLDIALATEATHSVTAVATDLAGNFSAASSPLAIQIDFTAPASAPAAPNLDSSTDTGFTNSDNITNDATPNFTFSNVGGVANLRLNIYSSIDGLVGFTTADGSGGVGGSGSTVTLVTDGVHTMTAKAADAAGNESAASTSLNVTLDRVAPTISFPVIFSYNGNSRETMVISFSETIGLADNASIANSASAGKRGFYANEGDIRDAGSLFDDGTNTLTLQSVSDGQWSAGDGSPTQITYTSTSGSATPADSNPANLIRDLAGNEMATVNNFVANDGGPPALATGFVFFPNGAAAETVVVQVDETLILAEGASVTGFTTTQGVPASVIYSGKGTTNTITFTSPGAGTWTESILFTYTQASGNVTDPSSNELLAFSNAPIRLISVNIASNNANGFTQKAKTGDLITLNFTANGTLSPAPTAKIGGVDATISGGPTNYTATLVAPIGLTEGVLPIQIIAETTADSTTVSATTNDSQIVFDKTSPVISSVAIASTNANTALAIPNDDVSVTFTVNEALAVTPTVTIAGRAASVSNVGFNYTATITMNGTDPEGAVAFSISLQDEVGNAASTSATNNASSVTYDRTSPKVVSINRQSATNGYSSTFGTSATSVTFRVTFSENIDPASLQNTDFQVAASGLGGAITIGAPSVITANSVYDIIVTGYTGVGTLGLNYVDNEDVFAVRDVAGNYTVTDGVTPDGDFTGQVYTIVRPQPTSHATGISITGITATSMTVNWTDQVAGTLPDGYLIAVQRSGATATIPADGTVIADQTNLIINNTGYLNVAYGVETATFSTLLSSENYTFFIYPYTNSGTDIDYRTAAVVPSASGATITGSSVWINNSNVPANPVTFSSTNTSSGTAVVNFSIQVYDDGWNFAADNASTKITQIKIRRNLGLDQIGNWSQALAGVELFNGTTTKTGTIDASGDFVAFSGLYDGISEFFGEVPDDQSRVFSLKLILKSPMTGNLPQIIDNKSFVFTINNADITVTSNSSLLNSQNDISWPISSSNTENKVDVIATQLDFTTSPSSPQLVLKNLTSTSTSPDFSLTPVIRARDVNGNTDADYSASINLSSAVATLPVSVSMTNGVASLSTVQYQDQGNGTLTASTSTAAANALVPSQGVSAAVTVNYSNTSVITSGTVSTEVSSLGTSFAALQPYRFTITDDGGAGIGDGSPTRISQLKITKKASANPIPDWTEILNIGVNGSSNNAGALIWDGTGSYLNASVTVNQNDITITNMLSTASTSDLGYIADGASKTYQVYIWLKPAMGGTLPSTVDFMNFDFEVDPANITLASQSSAILPAQLAINSGLIDVDVDATKLVFTTQPSSDVLVNTNLTTAGIVEARDANNNIDLDYSPGTGVTVTNTETLGMINLPTSFTNGVLTFPSNFQYTTIGSGATGNGTLTVASATLVNGVAPSSIQSTAITVRVGTASTITAGALTEPNTLSSLSDLIHDGGSGAGLGTEVFDFTINDDPAGTPANQNDGNPTRISSISITPGTGNDITDWTQAFAQVRLSDGSTSVFGTIQTNKFVFGGILSGAGQLGEIQDGLTKTYTLTVWLKQNLTGTLQLPINIDGQNFAFRVQESDILELATGTAIIAAEDEESGSTKNVVTVVATKLDFTNPATATSGSINVPFIPGGLPVMVEARDVNGNRDLGFAGTDSEITAFSTQGSVTTANAPQLNNASDVFTAGVFTFSTNFQYTSDVPASTTEGTLTINAGGGALPALTGTSSSIDIISSFESSLQLDPTFTIPAKIAYVSYQENSDIQNTATSYELYRTLLVDGSRGATYTHGGLPFNTNTDSGDGLPDIDQDGAPTNLTSITLRIYKPSTLRRIALYSNGVEISGTEINVPVDYPSIDENTLYQEFTWTGSPLLVAPNDTEVPLSVRVSFKNTFPELVDGDNIQIQLTAAVVTGGSQFFNGNPANSGAGGPYVAGKTPPAGPQSFGLIDVVATKFDFATQHAISGYAGINEPVSVGVVHANDQNGLLDSDFSNAVTLSSATAGLNYTAASFSSGILTLTGLRYTSAGAGKITVSYNSGAITSNLATPVNGLPNNAVTGHAIDVYHVNALPNTTGVVAATNIKGGSANVVVFGVTFKSDYNAGGHPKLNGFTINFDNPYKVSGKDIFKNIRIYKSSGGSFAGATNITVSDPGSTITQTNSNVIPATTLDQIAVAFQAGSEPVLTTDLTFYLVVDVDATANISTPKLTPRLVDAGYASPTDNHILTSRGSATGNVIGKQYSFATTRPPALVKSFPFNGQLNVDPNQDTISLVFDVGVWSFDSVAQLYDRYSNNLIATLQAKNGRFAGLTNPATEPVTDTLTFVIPPSALPLKPDSVYYLTIAKGTFNPGTQKGTGIADDGLNLYGGISYNGTVYFKVAGTKPPAMTGTDPGTATNPKYYITENGGAINAIFDKFGKAYFMVVDEGDPIPTNSQIRDVNDITYTGSVHARDTIDIKQISNPQYGSFDATLTSGTTYDVWICAENDALPTPFSTAAPFGSKNELYAEGGVEPTLKIQVNVAPGTLYVNDPLYQICANSSTILADPIIIVEGLNSDFTHPIRQDFNILLPAGFQFDTGTKPQISLAGPDFSNAVPSNPGQLVVVYLNNTILNVSFINTTSTGLDKITISGMKIIATSSDLSGRIRRFAGSAILPALPDGTTLARIVSQASEPLSFDNSYNLGNDFAALPIEIFNTVTYVPDNFVDASNQPVVRLFPIIPKGDYGPSQFSGSGVTNDLLSLTGVQLNSAFDITMTHTDMNGCVSTKVEQYTVYDHTEAIPVLGTEVCAPNNNFPGTAPSLLSAETVGWNALAGYSLISLTAKIPEQKDILSNTLNGPAWAALVAQIPVESPIGNEQAGFKSYKWDYSVLLNAVAESGGAIAESPYEKYRRTEKGQTYYTGGSIGFVEFTGKYRSNADNTVFIPVRQEVEIFVPARPIILVSGQSSNAGTTPIFCENDSDIQIEGFPRPNTGKSSGIFRVYDSLSNTLLWPVIPPKNGFADAANGTATLDPSLFNNSYNTIRIEYEYDDLESPCTASGNLYIRITPNPAPNFTTSSYVCAGTDITFTSGALIPAPFQLDSIGWNFGDQNAPAELNTSDLSVAQHRFNSAGNYVVNYAAYSNYGCRSNFFNRNITVGAVPKVDFDFAGLSTAEDITFRSKSTVAGPNPLAPSSPVARLDWRFGDGMGKVSFRNDSIKTHQYTAPNVYPVALTITSTVGCKDTLYKNVIVVNKVVTTDVLSREENFNTDQAGWQQWNLADSSKLSEASWKWGIADGPVITGTTNAWTTSSITTTGLSNYQPKERSALFTSVYDISALARPMVSFNSFVQTMQSDGVVLEYSTDSLNLADPNKKWTALGSLDQATNISTGVDWFNRGNLASKPGNQDLGNFGWSETLDPDGDNLQEWIESKHSLGAITKNNNRLVFRFALASVNDNPQVDGFAVDNFRIGNRTRIVLLENFRNLGNTATDPRGFVEKAEADSINAFNPSGVATSVVRINYHVAFPNKDPFNLDNNQDPGARALYYNISETPRARMDGQFPTTTTLFSGWGENFYNIRSLKLADALIVPTVTENPDGSGSVSIQVTALKDLGPETILNIALVERSVAKSSLSSVNQGFVLTGETQFDYVLKKLIPNASGTRFGTLLAQNGTRVFSNDLTWTKSFPLYGTPDDMSLVIFLQNENTKEIYQSEIIPINDPAIVTGVEDMNVAFKVFPNPADQEMTIELPANITEGATLRMFDQVGKVVNNATFEKGELVKTLHTGTHAGGVYLIQVETSKGILTRKVMVLHSH